jgi:polysaccharide biosynthesis protein PslG
MRKSLLVLALLAVTAGGCAFDDPEPSGPEPIPESELALGATYHPMREGVTDAEWERALEGLKELGGDVVRVDFGWDNFAPEPGPFDRAEMARFDRFLDVAERNEIGVYLAWGGVPCWQSSNPAPGLCPSKDPFEYATWLPKDWAQYESAVAFTMERWGDRLYAFEVWNEPNNPSFLHSSDAARDYVEILRHTYPVVKDSAPDLPVIAGSIAGSDGRFLQQLYDLGMEGLYDALSIHPYGIEIDSTPELIPPGKRLGGDRTIFSFSSGVEEIHRIMLRNDDESDLWLSEFGYPTCAPGSPDELCLTPAAQAKWLGRSVEQLRRWPFVRGALLYQLQDQPVAGVHTDFGLIDPAGKAKPSYAAVRRAIERLRG